MKNIQNLILSTPGLSSGLAWFEDLLDLQAITAGNFVFEQILEEIRFQEFDFSQVRIPKRELDTFWHYVSDEALRNKAYTMGKYISDKLPLWVEFSIRDNRTITNDG